MKAQYEIKCHGSQYGFPGWWTVYRNDQAVKHFEWRLDAKKYVAEQEKSDT